MSLQFIKQTLRSLRKDYGTGEITLTRYKIGDVDFINAAPSNTITSIVVCGIALPKALNVAFLPKTTLTVDRKTREFIIDDPNCTADWVKEGNYITYQGERYNIKWSESVENYYFFVRATSAGDEAAEKQTGDSIQGLVFHSDVNVVVN